ncbi:MAG: hypothetical protein AB7P14_29790 [Blastocatellales bacterium]
MPSLTNGDAVEVFILFTSAMPSSKRHVRNTPLLRQVAAFYLKQPGLGAVGISFRKQFFSRAVQPESSGKTMSATTLPIAAADLPISPISEMQSTLSFHRCFLDLRLICDYHLHSEHKAVAALRRSLNKSLAIFIERFSQDGHVVRKVSLFEDSIWPDHLQQFVFFQQISVMFDQRKQQVEILWLKQNGLILAQQFALGDVQPVMAKFVYGFWLMAHNSSQSCCWSISGKSLRLMKISPRG